MTRAQYTRERLLLLSAGHLLERKGNARAIEALRLLAGAVWLLIAGERPLEADLRALAARLRVAERVRFLGAVPYVELAGAYCGVPEGAG